MTVCSNCGGKVAPRASFCPSCGQASVKPDINPGSTQNSSRGRLRLLVPAMAVLFAIFTGGLVYNAIAWNAQIERLNLDIREQEEQTTSLQEKSSAAANRLQDAETAQSIAWNNCIASGISNIFSGRCLGDSNIASLKQEAEGAALELKNSKANEDGMRRDRSDAEIGQSASLLWWGILAGVSALALGGALLLRRRQLSRNAPRS